MTEKDPPTCSNCRYFYSDRHHCSHPSVMEFDPIHGRASQWVRSIRERGGACGPEGKLFELSPPLTTEQKARRWFYFGVAAALVAVWIYWPR